MFELLENLDYMFLPITSANLSDAIDTYVTSIFADFNDVSLCKHNDVVFDFSEKMLRGYVRMQAEANGVELSGERMAPRVRMHIPGNVRTGTYGPLIPKGVRQNRPLAQPIGTNNLPFAKARSGR